MKKFFKKIRQNQSGATAVEYGLIAALITVALLIAFGGESNEDAKSMDEIATLTKNSDD